jgi:hypothetical protein
VGKPISRKELHLREVPERPGSPKLRSVASLLSHILRSKKLDRHDPRVADYRQARRAAFQLYRETLDVPEANWEADMDLILSVFLDYDVT